MTGSLSGAGIFEATGGNLHITNAIGANVTGLEIDNVSPGTLQVDNGAASTDKVTFLGGAGTLALTSNTVSGIDAFDATIA